MLNSASVPNNLGHPKALTTFLYFFSSSSSFKMEGTKIINKHIWFDFEPISNRAYSYRWDINRFTRDREREKYPMKSYGCMICSQNDRKWKETSRRFYYRIELHFLKKANTILFFSWLICRLFGFILNK